MNKLAQIALDSYDDDEESAPAEGEEEGGDLESEVAALASALKSGDTKAAARALREAVALCK